jgi:heme/copper-type cytochrome/quinol oxidase subunit 3
MKVRPTLNIAALPGIGFGVSAPLWWGNLMMIVIEGTLFALTIVTYYYISLSYDQFPPARTLDPDLLWGTLNVLLLLLSIIPGFLAQRAAERDNAPRLMLMLGLIILAGLGGIALRVFEFHHLHCRWDSTAYGSVIWTLLGMHTFHLIAATGESILLFIWCLFKGMDKKHRLDLEVNSAYWYFMTGSFAVIYVVIYWSPKFL